MNILPCSLNRKDSWIIRSWHQGGGDAPIKLLPKWHKKKKNHLPHDPHAPCYYLRHDCIHKKRVTQHPCRKFETKDMEHEGQFSRLLSHINPPALSSHCCTTFFCSHFLSLQAAGGSSRTSVAGWEPPLCFGPASHASNGETVCHFQDKSSTRY